MSAARRMTGFGCPLVVAVLTAAARAPFVLWPQLHFDSDQAIIGLMSLDLLAGRSLPVFYYGQTYLASIEPYLAAPFLWLAGADRAALKLPMLLMNVLTLLLYYRAFRLDAAQPPRRALLLVAPLAVPAVLMASLLTDACGGNWEPAFWIILMWMSRRRPLLLGLVAGLALQGRLFCLYGLLPLLALIVWRRAWRPRGFALFTAALVATYSLIAFAARYAPNYFGLPSPTPSFDPAAALRLAPILLSDLLPTLFGLSPTPLTRFSIAADLTVNPFWSAAAVAAGLLLILAAALYRPGFRRVERWDLPLLLIATGTLALLGFLVLPSPTTVDPFVIRYLLLVPLLPVGAAALLLQTRGARLVLLGLALWTAANLSQSAALWAHAVRRPPPDPCRELAAALRDLGVRAAWAHYRDAYQLTFMLNEDVIVTTPAGVRIRRYNDIIAAAPGNRPQILLGDIACPGAVHVAGFTICPEPPAGWDFSALLGRAAPAEQN